MFRRLGLSVPKDGDIVASIHDELIAGLGIHQSTLQVLLGCVGFDLRFDVFLVHIAVLFDIGELVDRQGNRFTQLVAIQVLDSSVSRFR